MPEGTQRRPEIPAAIDRMVRIADVAWGRAALGDYWVMWSQDGARQVKTFKTAFGARRFAEALDPLGDRQPTMREIRAAERAIEELEDELREEERAELAALGVPIMTPRQRRKADIQLRRLGEVGVRRHVRRRANP